MTEQRKTPWNAPRGFMASTGAFDTERPPERAIFQTFWKDDCGTESLVLELETSNFGY